VEIRDIAAHLQQDLIETPQEKPTSVLQGRELRFVQRFLGDWEYQLPTAEIKTLAANARSYEDFVRRATK